MMNSATAAATPIGRPTGGASVRVRRAADANDSRYASSAMPLALGAGGQLPAQFVRVHGTAGRYVGLGLPDLLDRTGCGQQVQGLLERLEVRHGHDDRLRPSVPGDHNPFVRIADVVEYGRQPGLRLGE